MTPDLPPVILQNGPRKPMLSEIGMMDEVSIKFGKLVGIPDGNGCWPWNGSMTPMGYGTIQVKGYGAYRAHRVSYEIHKGPIPSELVTDHLCRNKRCVNPDHLELVPSKTNTQRGNSLSNINRMKKFCCRGHEFTPDNTYDAQGFRGCVTCKKITDRLSKERQKARRKAALAPASSGKGEG